MVNHVIYKYNKRAKMALSRSPEFMGVIVQIVCALEIQFKSALALTNIASGTTCCTVAECCR